MHGRHRIVKQLLTTSMVAALLAAAPIAPLAPLAPAQATETATSQPTPDFADSAPATVSLAAPKPTSTAVSPEAPDPHPPLGGRAPDGSVPGGAALAGRGLILPPKAPKLPAGLTARAWILVDLGSGQILAARDPHGRYQPASILKTLTAVTLLPQLAAHRVVTVSPAAATAEGSAVGLLAGAKYTVDDLFAAMLLVSGNDAAQALAEAGGGVAHTVAQMNLEAARLGAYDTVVQTPSGLDGWSQLTSAYDMALVLRAAVSDPRFIAYDRLPSATFPAKASRYGRVGSYEFDNQSAQFFQSVPGALVAKTGYTDAALHTYICATQRAGRRLGVVFLRNQRIPFDQYQQAAALLNWGYALPRSTPAVGQLAGPINPSAGGAAATAKPGAGAGGPNVAAAAAAAEARAAAAGQPRVSATAGLTAGVLVLAAACVATLRRTRRRSLRQY